MSLHDRSTVMRMAAGGMSGTRLNRVLSGLIQPGFLRPEHRSVSHSQYWEDIARVQRADENPVCHSHRKQHASKRDASFCSMGRSPSLLELLRHTLARVQNTAELPKSNPHRLELKHNLLIAIAELEEKGRATLTAIEGERELERASE